MWIGHRIAFTEDGIGWKPHPVLLTSLTIMCVRVFYIATLNKYH